MRYTLAEQPTIIGKFNNGDTVTMSLYDLSDGSSVPITNTCTEIGSTGVFKWGTSNITSYPTTLKEYLWIMNNGSISKYGKIVLGGYVENVADSDTIAGAVWDEPITGHTSSGTFGNKVAKKLLELAHFIGLK